MQHEATQIEMAGITFTPAGTMDSFPLNDLAQMKIGTKLNGMLVIRKDGQANEYVEGVLEVQEEGLCFLEND